MKKYLSCKGFTLIEILVTVLIIAVLVSMAVPMYERMIEKSHRAEVSITLKRLSEAKMRLMTTMNLDIFPSDINISQLDSSFISSSEFGYSLYPAGEDGRYTKAVCAKRKRGKNAGTVFVYLGEVAPEICQCGSGSFNATSICHGYCTDKQRLFCKESKTNACEVYGMESVSTAVSCDNIN